MELSDYTAGIQFHLIQPHMPRPVVTRPYPTVDYYRQNLCMEMDNAVLPADEKTLRQYIWTISDMPRLSSYVNGAIINRAVSQMNNSHVFVNAGAYNAFSLNPFHFFAGMLGNPEKLCIGVDHFDRFGHGVEPFQQNFNQLKSGCHFFFNMDYAQYFAHVHNSPIGCYLFDGVHDYECRMKGLQCAQPFFADGCIILAADTNWPEIRQAMLDFVRYGAGNYRILLDMQTNGNCHPTFWNGFMVIQKLR
jgi:hypothetical protein